MQQDNKGNICNSPQFKIHGDERRALKKKCSLLKSYVKTFWQYEDIDRVYGGGMEDYQCEIKLKKAKQQIEEWEIMLAEKFDMLSDLGIK